MRKITLLHELRVSFPALVDKMFATHSFRLGDTAVLLVEDTIDTSNQHLSSKEAGGKVRHCADCCTSLVQT